MALLMPSSTITGNAVPFRPYLNIIYEAGTLTSYMTWFCFQAYETGMKASMEKYKTDNDIKKVIDETQIHYQCCGGKDFQDWFYTWWIDIKYVNLQRPAVFA